MIAYILRDGDNGKRFGNIRRCAEATGSNYENLVAAWYCLPILFGSAAHPGFDLPSSTSATARSPASQLAPSAAEELFTQNGQDCKTFLPPRARRPPHHKTGSCRGAGVFLFGTSGEYHSRVTDHRYPLGPAGSDVVPVKCDPLVADSAPMSFEKV